MGLDHFRSLERYTDCMDYDWVSWVMLLFLDLVLQYDVTKSWHSGVG